MSDRERTLLDLSSLNLRAKPPEGASYPATFKMQLWRNRVSMTVFSGVKSLPRSGVFGVNLHPTMFYGFVEDFLDILNKPNDGNRITRKIKVFDKATQDKQLLGELVYGKDQENIPYICVITPNVDAPKIVFRIEPSRNYEVTGAERAEVAILFAKGYLQFYKQVMSDRLISEFVDESRDNHNRGSGGRKSTEVDADDIPF